MTTKSKNDICTNMLSDYPQLFDEVDRVKNKNINIFGITAGSNRKIWWVCSKNTSHQWEATVYHRVKGVGCPICSNRLIIAGINDLATINPLLSSEWHPILNNELKPSDVGPASHTKVWWKCKVDSNHYWKSTVKSRASGTDCGMCRMLIVVHGVNDLSVTNRNLYEELHPTLNEVHGINKDTLAIKSNKKVWWQCRIDNSHSWQAIVNDRSKGNGCPRCKVPTIIYGVNDFSTLYPKLYAEIHPEMNAINNIDSMPLSSSSTQKFWWRCSKNPHHYWNSSIVSRVAGSGCSMCSGHYIVHGVNDLSVTNANLYSQLHKSLNKINNKDTTRLSPSTAQKVWWQCEKNKEHYWNASVSHTANDRGCSMCSGKYVVHGINDLSVNYPEIYKQLHPSLNAGLNLDTISPGSNRSIWWVDSYGHTWKATTGSRVQGSGCPYCANKAVLIGWNDLETVNPDLAKEWNHAKNFPMAPNELTTGSSKSVWWACQSGHEWKSVVSNRNRGNGCPECIQASTSKIQQAFHKALAVKIPDLQCDARIPVPFKTRKSMSVDMISVANNVVIEYDGEYYHSGKRSGKTLQHHLDHDSEKTQVLLDAGYTVVRIRENTLPHLDMTHSGLVQVTYRNGEALDNVVDIIVDSI